MAKNDAIAHNDAALAAQAEQIAANLPTYAVGLGIPTTDVTAHTADSGYLRYSLNQQDRYVKVGQAWTSWKNLVRDGGSGGVTSAPAHPAAPASPPTAVAPGIVPRMRSLIRRIKASANYSVAIGTALGIEGTEQAAPDLGALQPVLTPTVEGDRVHVGWTRGKADALELHVDRSDGKGFAFLAIDTVPDYIDTEALPASPTVWKYKAIYRVDDEKVGQWSLPVSIPVGG